MLAWAQGGGASAAYATVDLNGLEIPDCVENASQHGP
jgi:hypothetical protein